MYNGNREKPLIQQKQIIGSKKYEQNFKYILKMFKIYKKNANKHKFV
jgi:hypothetical protein